MENRAFKKILIRVCIIVAVIFMCIINIFKSKYVYNEWQKDDIKVKQPFEISILSTGKSDFILVEVDGEFIVIDAATYENSRKIYDYLKLKNVEEIEYLIFTHNDKDHIGAAPVILNNFTIKNLIQADYEKNTIQYKSYIEAVEENGLSPILLHKIIDTNVNGANIKIYPAKESSYKKSNNYCIIVSIQYGKHKFLFAADAENTRMKEFIEDNKESYTFLKMPHHGIYSKAVEDFLESVNPTYAAVTCSYLRYPDRKVLSLLDKYKIETFYTSNGDIIIKSDGENIYFN